MHLFYEMMIIGDHQFIRNKIGTGGPREHVFMKFRLNTSLKFHNYNIKIENNEFFVYKTKNDSR